MNIMPGNINSIVLAYLLFINLFGFICMYIDKKLARLKRHRISEKFLFTIALSAGFLGIWIGMYYFRHKTKKNYFTIGIPTIFIIEFILVILIKMTVH